MKLFFKTILVIIAVICIGGGIYVTLKDKNTSLPSVPAVIGEAFDRGDFDKAIELSNELLKSEPNNVYAILFLSQTYAQKGSLEFKEQEYGEKALVYANQALAFAPKDAKVYIAIGYANEIMQKYPESFTAYAKAIDLDPKSAEGYIRLGHAYDLSGDIVKARENYLKAASIDPTNPQVAQNLGRLYVRTGEVDRAVEQFKLVAENSANARLKAEAYYNLSTMSFHSNSVNNLKESIAYASTSVSIDPEYPLAYLALGRVYVTQKDFVKAASMLDKAISLYPNLSAVYEWQARMSYLKNDKTTAISLYDAQKKAALLDIGLMDNERNKSISDAAFNQAFIFTELNQKVKAISALNEAVEKANPITLLIIKFTLDSASSNELKSLINEQSFKDLLVKVNEKVQAEEERLKGNNPVSILDGVKSAINLFKIKKALAETRSCGSYNGAPVTYPFNAGSWTSNASAVWFCNSTLDYLNGKTIPLALLTYYANAIDPNAAGVVTNNYNGISGAVYLGCANGVGATYIPVMRTLTVTKTGTGTGSVTGTGISCGTDCSETVANNTNITLTATASSGSTFAGWSNACTNTSGTCSVALSSDKVATARFNLNVIPLSATCSANPSSGSAPLNVTWTAIPSDGSGTYTYLWSNGVTGTGISTTTRYTTDGTYYATVTVSDGSTTRTVSCPGTVNSTGCTGSCGGGVVVSSSVPTLSLTASPTPIAIGSSTLITWVIGNGGYTTCTASNGWSGTKTATVGTYSQSDTPTSLGVKTYTLQCTKGAVTTTASASILVNAAEGTVTPEDYDCSVSMVDQPTNNKAAVNTNTKWEVTGDLPGSGYTRYWVITEGNGVSEVSSGSSDMLNKIFTTIGLKTVGIRFASSSNNPADDIFCSDTDSVATTSVVLPGTTNEI